MGQWGEGMLADKTVERGVAVNASLLRASSRSLALELVLV